jgi:hypothetical protein
MLHIFGEQDTAAGPPPQVIIYKVESLRLFGWVSWIVKINKNIGAEKQTRSLPLELISEAI